MRFVYLSFLFDCLENLCGDLHDMRFVYFSFLFDCLENLCVALGCRFLNWQDDKSIEYCSKLNLKIKFC